MNLEILFEDKEIIVCYKPAGVASQNDRSYQPDMCSLIKNHIILKAKENKTNLNGKEPYVGVVHRLDKPVEGIIVYGKTSKATAYLSGQVSGENGSKKGMLKKYLTYVHGSLPIDSAHNSHILQDYLLHDKKAKSASVVDKNTIGAKAAKLEYQCLKQIQPETEILSMLDITLITGRFHQIRIQLANAGYPIVGDRKYGNSEDSCKKLQLFAYQLSFFHPNGKYMTFQKTISDYQI